MVSAAANAAVPSPPDPHKVRLAEQARREKNAANWTPSPAADKALLAAHNRPKFGSLASYKIRSKKKASSGYYNIFCFDGGKLVDVKQVPDLFDDEKRQTCLRIKKRLFPVYATDEYLYVNLSGVHSIATFPVLSTSPDSRQVNFKVNEPRYISDLDGSFLKKEAAEYLSILKTKFKKTEKTDDDNKRSEDVGHKLKLLVSRLQNRSLAELRQMWINALNKQNAPGPFSRQALDSLIASIEEEWRRRGALGIVDTADYFKWPSTEANPSKSSMGEFEAPGQGVLGYLEYHVGKTNGQPTKIRRAILERVFNGKLPPVFDKKYLQQWGEPGSAPRLQKMAESIAAFTRNFKRRDDDKLDQAIREWEADLLFLFEQYYIGKFHFAWPTTKIG